MKSERFTPGPKQSGGSLSLVAWTIMAVAAPAAVFWFSGRGRAGRIGPVEPGAPILHRDSSGDAPTEHELAAHRARMQEWLQTYGWVDRDSGIARSPIEEGMEAVLREGLPTREEIDEDR